MSDDAARVEVADTVALTLRLTPADHERLRRQAFEQRTTVTALIRKAINQQQAAQPIVVTAEQVEAVARALWDNDEFHGVGTWPDVANPNFYRRQARAALGITVEPTP